MDRKKILVICDDLTGAGDVASWAVDSGLKQKICDIFDLDKISFEDFDILIIDTESRFDDKKALEQKFECIVKWAKIHNLGFIFKKIDSTLRGNFVAEIDVLIKNFWVQHLPFVAAYPEYGRKTINGYHYVYDKLLHETDYANDPKNPIVESHIPTLIKNKSSFFEIYNVYDVNKDDDFEKIIDDIKKYFEEDKIKICAGTAKFFGEILNGIFKEKPYSKSQKTVIARIVFPFLSLLGVKRRSNFNRERLPRSVSSLAMTGERRLKNIFIISGSFNSVTKKQLDNFYGKFFLKIVEKTKNYVFFANDTKNIFAIESPRIIDKEYDLKNILDKAKKELEKLDYKNTLIILTGGDTAYKFCKYIGIFDIEVAAKIFAGIVLCRDSQKKIYFILKPGGFGDEDFLVRMGLMIEN